MRWHALSASVALLAAAGTPLAAQQLDAADRLTAVARVWAEARFSYAGWDRVRADWDSALQANLIQAGARQSDLQFLARLRRFLALLNDPLAQIDAPPLRSRLARPPIALRWLEERAVILDYAENSEMRMVRPERSAEILAVQGIATAAWIRDSILPEIAGANEDDRWRRATEAMLDGVRNTAVHLTLRLPDGSQRGASVTRRVTWSDRWPLIPPSLTVASLPDSIAVVQLNSLGDDNVVARFDRSFRSWQGIRALILDLRSTDDGQPETGYQILARLVDRPFLTVQRRTPRHEPVELRAFTDDSLIGWSEAPPDTVAPRTDLPGFGGPVVILSSPRTAGAAEDLIAAFRGAGRGFVIGARTAGVAGRAITVPLPRNWQFRLTVTRHLFPDGREFAGDGIAPDIEVAEVLRDLRDGRDAALERARQYLAEAVNR